MSIEVCRVSWIDCDIDVNLKRLICIPDRHHSEGDVLRGHVVRALDFVDFIGFCHHDTVMLEYHGVAVHSGLEQAAKISI